nr:type II toxin-antitoxin system RelE/ParE family toxin [Kingella kingae]
MKQQFKSALAKRLENPRIPSAALHNMPDCYKIKLRKIGYRLVYRVDDNVITVTVIAIGKRDKSVVYDVANSRL